MHTARDLEAIGFPKISASSKASLIARPAANGSRNRRASTKRGRASPRRTNYSTRRAEIQDHETSRNSAPAPYPSRSRSIHLQCNHRNDHLLSHLRLSRQLNIQRIWHVRLHANRQHDIPRLGRRYISLPTTKSETLRLGEISHIHRLFLLWLFLLLTSLATIRTNEKRDTRCGFRATKRDRTDCCSRGASWCGGWRFGQDTE